MYNKKEIMMQAWAWFNNDEISIADIEWTSYLDTEKTFAVCLKASWEKAKEDIENAKKEAEDYANSEEVKAFDWAESKLNVQTGLSDEMKFKMVCDEKKFNFFDSVWSNAMRAVRLHIELTNNKK